MTPTVPTAIGIARGRVRSGVSISSAAFAIDSKPVNAYSAAIVASVKPVTVSLPIRRPTMTMSNCWRARRRPATARRR